jgi:hypothetical protein
MTTLPRERLLARMFFARFFESDVLSGIPQAQFVIWGIAGLSAPGFTMALWLGRSYTHVVHAGRPGLLMQSVLRDQLLYVTFSMMALGFVALLMWESVFPDRRDVRVLDVLPISTRTHVVARLAALGMLAALFAIGINVPAAVAFGLDLWVYDVANSTFRLFAGHLMATASAGLCAFFLVIVVQGLLLNLFGSGVARRLALILQSLFVVVLIQTLFLTPLLAARVGAAFQAPAPAVVTLLPPAMFVALYDLVGGVHRPHQALPTLVAVASTVSAAFIAAVLIACSYRRLVRMALETPDGGGQGASRLWRGIPEMLTRAISRDPVQRAVAGFTIRSLARSRPHLTLLATYIGLAAALIIAAIVPAAIQGRLLARQNPNVVLLAAPLVLNFFVLCGLRVLFGIPTTIRANWTFRIHAPDDRADHVMIGVRRTMLFTAVAPIAAAAGVLGTVLWGAGRGAVYLGFTAGLGVALSHVLLMAFRKIPFACTYFPGRSRVQTLWPMYGGALLVYAFGLGSVEREAMRQPVLLAVVLAAMVASIAAVAGVRRVLLPPVPRLIYEEDDPDRIFDGFRLSEGLAAETAPAPQASASSRTFAASCAPKTGFARNPTG